MAKGTAKANVKTNAKRLLVFRLLTLGLGALHATAIYMRDSMDFWPLMGISFWTGQQLLMISLLAKAGAATYDAEGNIIDCIDLADPKQLGFYGYAQDILWVCWLLQPLSLVWELVAYLWAVIPVFAAYKLWTGLLRPAMGMRGNSQAPETAVEDEAAMDPRSRLQRRREAAQKKGMQAGGIRQR